MPRLYDLNEATADTARLTAHLFNAENSFQVAEENLTQANNEVNRYKLAVKEAVIKEQAIRDELNRDGPKHLRGYL